MNCRKCGHKRWWRAQSRNGIFIKEGIEYLTMSPFASAYTFFIPDERFLIPDVFPVGMLPVLMLRLNCSTTLNYLSVQCVQTFYHEKRSVSRNARWQCRYSKIFKPHRIYLERNSRVVINLPSGTAGRISKHSTSYSFITAGQCNFQA